MATTGTVKTFEVHHKQIIRLVKPNLKDKSFFPQINTAEVFRLSPYFWAGKTWGRCLFQFMFTWELLSLLSSASENSTQFQMCTCHPQWLNQNKPFYQHVRANNSSDWLLYYLFYVFYLLINNCSCLPVLSKVMKALWWYYFSKLIEFMDTFFFILRKNNHQITFLHVYHHVSMLNIWWFVMNWIPSGHSKSLTATLYSSV